MIAGATVNGCKKDFSLLSLLGSKDKSIAKIPTKLLPGLQAANAGDGELWEFSQQQQFPPALIICGSAMLQVFAINSGQPCNELLIMSKVKMNILENNWYIVSLEPIHNYGAFSTFLGHDLEVYSYRGPHLKNNLATCCSYQSARKLK